MNVVEELMNEQIDIQIMINVLYKMNQNLRKEEPIDSDQLNQTLKFFNLFCNKCHTKKMNDVLLVAMKEGNVDYIKEPVSELTKYQEYGQQVLEKINTFAELYTLKSDKKAEKALNENIKQYIDSLAHQFDIETHHIFGLANKYLSLEKRHELAKKLEDLEVQEECNASLIEFKQLITQYKKTNYPFFRRLDHFEYPCSYIHIELNR